jgi:hypothetical protein
VVKFSEKLNFEKEHVHIIELKNNSKLLSTYALTIVNKDCSEDTHHHSKSTEKQLNLNKESYINTEVYIKDLKSKTQKGDIISLKPNESIKIYLKTLQKDNAKLGFRNCTSIQASVISKNKSKSFKSIESKSVSIETLVPNPNNKGH